MYVHDVIQNDFGKPGYSIIKRQQKYNRYIINIFLYLYNY